MRQFQWMLGTIFLVLSLVTGCNQSASNTGPESAAPAKESSNPSIEDRATTEVNDAIKAAENYKNAEYEINASEDILSVESVHKRNETIKPYLTEQFYEKASNTRYTLLPLKVADKQKVSLKLVDLQCDLREKKENIVVLNYKLNLLFLNQEGKETKRIPIDGILTLFNINGQWLVQGDTFDVNTFKDFIVEK
ncbi:hypothetical protein [Paenibacillus durus]|uniref:Lipoprotein n=1 Tax=Paenibacillus durus ATCC 35681 TaxID=1333534 RepID=A0A0F7CGI3_PAEDU|nr:hypothetical protein [Paenibacillus durus]AKG33521.1 hypothetical protein VK70_02045 [Paenibacillus durus ATCC 35681]